MPRPKKYKKTKPKSPILATWESLNQVVKDADEALCVKLLREEKVGRNRGEFVKRLARRIARLRREAEFERLIV